MQSKEPLFIQCSCYGEGLIVEPEEYDTTFGLEVDISFWSKGLGDPRYMRLRDKVRVAWRILRRGRPYHDMVCLNKSELLKLRDYLSELLASDEKADS
jgi:hypothetical protein